MNALILLTVSSLVVQLARDMQQDFYPHFPTFFDVIVSFITQPGQTPEIMETSFTCLSFLFKFLWKSMVRDIVNVLEYVWYAHMGAHSHIVILGSL